MHHGLNPFIIPHQKPNPSQPNQVSYVGKFNTSY